MDLYWIWRGSGERKELRCGAFLVAETGNLVGLGGTLGTWGTLSALCWIESGPVTFVWA